MDKEMSSGLRKRTSKFSSPETENANGNKMRKISSIPAIPEIATNQFHPFMKLPNELIVKIFERLKPSERIRLALLHPRLILLSTSQSTLWNIIQIDNEFCNNETIELIITNNFIKPNTNSIEISTIMNGSNRAMRTSIPPTFLDGLALLTPQISELKLIGQTFDEEFPNLFTILLPKTLKILDLTRTFVSVIKFQNIPSESQTIDIEQSYSYFKGIENNLSQLEVLILDSCIWLLPYDLLYIRLLRNLKTLSMVGCRLSERNNRFMGEKVHVNEPIAIKRVLWRRILSALQNGFDKLEMLDITNSDINRMLLIDVLFRNVSNNRPPIRILKLGYYDADYVWALSGAKVLLLRRCSTLEELDVSGFPLVLLGENYPTRVCHPDQLTNYAVANYEKLKILEHQYCGDLSGIWTLNGGYKDCSRNQVHC